jgi:branched-chain amino acid transport system permease protein
VVDTPVRTSTRDVARRLPTLLVWLVLAMVALWVLFLAEGTSAGPAVSDPGTFVITLLNALTFAGLLFVVASGFTLIFGLMRTVNMAHGSLFLLAGFTAISLQQSMVGKTTNIAPEDVSIVSWIVPLLLAAALAAVLGVVLHQVFLRWNQGQELRQALITIAISVILADQMLRQFGGLAKTMVWPGAVSHYIEVFGERYARVSTTREWCGRSASTRRSSSPSPSSSAPSWPVREASWGPRSPAPPRARTAPGC